MTRRVSDVHDVQGIVRGYSNRRFPVGRFLFIQVKHSKCGREVIRELLERGWIASAQTWDDRVPEFRINIALTHDGLRALDIPWPVLDSFPKEFKAGMRARAEVIGDDDESSPDRWELLWQGNKVHAWIGIYAKDQQMLDQMTGEIENLLREYQCDLEDFQDVGHLRPGGKLPELPIEHFGFVDNVSNPPVSGLNRDGQYAGGRLDDRGQWDTIAAGEFLLGPYQDEILERPKAPASNIIATNSTYMVYRKLHQDVDAFREYIKIQGDMFGSNPDEIAAKMVGRNQDGTPLVEQKKGKPINDFLYANDPDGKQCPLGSHVRRTNPRDTFGFGTKLVNRHRMLRRGIPYGDFVEEDQSAEQVNKNGDQGLIFISLSVSIERQFEFVQQQWVNYGDSLLQGSDKDPLTGSNLHFSHFKIPGDGQQPLRICTKLPRFVKTRGGDYFFVPGIQALNYIASGRYLETGASTVNVPDQQIQIS